MNYPDVVISQKVKRETHTVTDDDSNLENDQEHLVTCIVMKINNCVINKEILIVVFLANYKKYIFNHCINYS